jgi:prophage DNA circulation protein
MSWKTEYRQGSFRGVAFRTTDRQQSGGRNGELHEFPSASEDGKDHLPWFEDMGRTARGFDFECWVAGDDHLTQAQRLIDALEAKGPGTLLDPFRGELTVAVTSYSVRESGVQGGVSEFSISFAETTGEPTATASAPDSQAKAAEAAQAVRDELPMRFAARFSTDKLPAFIEDAAVKLVEGTALLAQATAAPMGGAGAVLRAFDAGLRLLPTSARSLVRTPLALAHSVSGLLSALSALSSDPRRRAASARAMAGYGTSLKPVTGDTPPRLAEDRNQAAFTGLVRTLAAAELVDALASMRFASYDEAVRERALAADLIDALAMDAADALDDDRWQLLRGLRSALVADLTARGATLARVYDHPVQATEPALATARRLYDRTADIEARAADLVARNAIPHPGFVAGGEDISVLQEQAA